MIKKYCSVLIVFVLLSIGAQSYAESYRGIEPFDTLSDIKKKFPGATYAKIKPAWAQEYDVIYSITGFGMSGEIIVLFFDWRPNYKKRLETETNERRRQSLQKFIDEWSEDNMTVGSPVRWIPDSAFPVSRLITKYGKPEKSDYREDDYTPYKEWKSKGISAFLSDDGKNVVSMEFYTTDKEFYKACKEKFGADFCEKPKEHKKK